MRYVLTPLKLSLFLFISVFPFTSYADGDAEKILSKWSDNEKNGVPPVELRQYSTICGNCHFPYQPGLLPPLSWEMTISNFDKHFGKVLHISTLNRKIISNYLLDNAAGRVNNELSNKILQTLSYDPVVIRITDTPYFMKRHHDVDNRDNIKLMGQCDQCHKDAIQGKY
ncbi:MAG: diheme cytochrome c [Chromatiales bacterium]|nr:diheme cytochrome c [Chromatiales bacterium]